MVISRRRTAPMENRHIVLKLFTQELGVEGEINSFDDRKEFQKVVLLGQSLSGVDLGYRFNWYLHGPYSPALARDYYQMAEAVELGDQSFEGRSLNAEIRQKLGAIRDIVRAPDTFRLQRSDWLELLASWYYLRFIVKYDEPRALETMRNSKSHLVPYIDDAKRALQRFGL